MSWQTIVKENNLSVREIYLSEIGNNLRIEAEFYTTQTSSKGLVRGVDVVAFSQYGTSKELNEENLGKPVLRLNEFELLFSGKPAKYSDLLSENEFISLKLKKGDVLICRTNGNPEYVGKSALVMEDTGYAFASYLFRINTNGKISPATLVAYLNSKIGRQEIEKYSIVSNQANFSPAKFREITIPLFTKDFEDHIEKIFSRAWMAHKEANKAYLEAEQMLLKEINLEGYKGTDEAISVRKFSEALADNRFDAEYWQPDFDDIESIIKKNKDGFDELTNLFVVLDKKTQIDPEKEYLYSELADINGVTGAIDNFTLLKGKELPSRGRMLLKKNDIIVSSVEGSLNKIAIVYFDEKNIIGSTGFFVLRQKEYEPEVAVVLLKSKPIQMLLKRQAQGTILTSIAKSSLHRIILPKINKSVQMKVKDMIIKSHEERQKAKELLEKAKRAVEIFVEKNEEEALKYLGI